MTLAPAATINTGIWRDHVHPSSVWAGDMTDKGYPNEPSELETYPGGTGVLRTEYGWFPVKHFEATSTLSFDIDASNFDIDASNFDIDASNEVAPDSLDKKIVQRAAAILSAEEVWNRSDNRKCPANATTWSIYCAVEKASIEVTGGFTIDDQLPKWSAKSLTNVRQHAITVID